MSLDYPNAYRLNKQKKQQFLPLSYVATEECKARKKQRSHARLQRYENPSFFDRRSQWFSGQRILLCGGRKYTSMRGNGEVEKEMAKGIPKQGLEKA